MGLLIRRRGQITEAQAVFVMLVFAALLIGFIVFRLRAAYIGEPPKIPRNLDEYRAAVAQVVGRHTELPPGVPDVEVIQDVELRQRVHPYLYRHVELGDLVLHYPTLVVVYRPTTDQVIEKLPIASGN